MGGYQEAVVVEREKGREGKGGGGGGGGSQATKGRKTMAIIGMSSVDIFYLGLALCFNTFTAPAVKITQEKDGSYAYNKYCVYFIAEMIKLIVAGIWTVYTYQTNSDMRRVMKVTTRDVWQYAIPGFVFFAQNNLSFIALQHMSNAAFQLLLNMRIVVVALLTVVVLQKPLNKVKWFAIILLTNGAVQYQLSGCASEGGLKTSMEGLLVMMIIIACAAGGNIVTQLVMQKNMEQPLMLQNTILYTWGVLMNGANWFVSVQSAPAGTVEWFGAGFGGAAFSLCVFNAIYGLSISVILKRFGSITRTFISTVAIVLNAVLDTLFFSEKITLLEMSTFLTIFAAIFLFTILGDDWGKMVKATETPKSSGTSPLSRMAGSDSADRERGIKDATSNENSESSTLLGMSTRRD